MKSRNKYIGWIAFAVILVASVVFGYLFFLSDPPIGSIIVTDIDDFGKYNRYVKNQMAEEFQGSFPTQSSNEWHDTSYYYEYNCGILGDADFCVDLQISTENEEYYLSEKERVASLISESVKKSNGEQCYILVGDENDISDYFDDETQDGRYFCFEFVVFDDAEIRVEYLSAQLCDNRKTTSHIETVLLSVFGEE